MVFVFYFSIYGHINSRKLGEPGKQRQNGGTSLHLFWKLDMYFKYVKKVNA